MLKVLLRCVCENIKKIYFKSKQSQEALLSYISPNRIFATDFSVVSSNLFGEKT